MRSMLTLVLLVCTFGNAVGQPRSMSVGDATIAYELVGRGSAIVLIHGWALDMLVWDDQVEALADSHRVLRYDRRGFGRSSGHADRTADPNDLRILMDSLGIRSATILGLSAGAGVALDFAVAFPDRVDALVLYGSGPPVGFAPMPPGPPPPVVLGEIARTHGMDSLTKAVNALGLTWVPPDRPAAARRMEEIWRRYDGRDLLDPRPPSGRIPPARMDHLPGIRVPTLVVSGDHDLPFLRAVGDTLASRIAGARRVIIEDGGHGAHIAQPDAFNAAVLEFLAGVTPNTTMTDPEKP